VVEGEQLQASHDALLIEYSSRFPTLYTNLMRQKAHLLPDNLSEILPSYSSEDKGNATRKLRLEIFGNEID